MYPQSIFLLYAIVVLLRASSHCMNECSNNDDDRTTLYQEICCQQKYFGKTSTHSKKGGTAVILCPPEGLQLCERSQRTLVFNDCKGLYEAGYTTSGNYTIHPNGETPIQVYCDMEGTNCDGNGGWTRVAYLNMTQSGATCPNGLTQIQYANISYPLCASGTVNGCDSTTFPSRGINYTQVCGYLRGYQFNSPDAFGSLSTTNEGIDGNYLDGISITHGTNPRHHIWSYAAGLRDNLNTLQGMVVGCPCNTGYSGPDPNTTFISSHYYCESGGKAGQLGEAALFPNDPLWDGMGCGGREAPCCNSSMPWFYRVLYEEGEVGTSDGIELRICNDEDISNENVPLDIIKLFIK